MRSGNLLDPVSQVIDSIRELLVEVRRESETLLQARILEIFKVNQRMEKELTLLRAQVGGKCFGFSNVRSSSTFPRLAS